MSVITDIKKQAKRARFSVFVDGQYKFSCSELELATFGLAVGDYLDDQKLGELSGQAEIGRYYDRVLNYLAIRPRSKLEITRYLKRKDCPEEVADQIVQRLKAQKLIDDSDFGNRWVESRQLNRYRSKRHLIYELREKGLDKEEIEAATHHVDDVITLKRMLAERSLAHKYPDQKKLMSYLARQGFSYDSIQSAMRATKD